MSSEEEAVAHGGSVKAPKVLADIVESIAAAIYVDVNFDLQRLWVVCTKTRAILHFCSFIVFLTFYEYVSWLWFLI